MTHFWIPVGARVAWAHHSHHPTIDSLPGLNAAQAALLGVGRLSHVVSFGVHIHLVVHLVENVESPTGWEWDDTHDEIRPINMVMRQWCAQKWWNHPLAMWKRAIEMGKVPSGGCNQQLANMMNIDFLTYSQSNRMFMFHKIGSGWCFWTVGANVGLEKGCKWGIHIYKTYLWMLSCIFTYFIVFTLQDIYRIRRFLQLSMSSRSAGGSSFDPNSFWVKLYWPLSGGEQASWARDYDHYRSMDQFGTGQTRLRSKKTHRFVVYLEILKSCMQPRGSRMTWSVPPLLEPASWYGRCLQLWQVVEDIGLVVTPGDDAPLKFHACLWFT